MDASLEARVAAAIRAVPDFPQPGVLFRDITPLLADPVLLHHVTAHMARQLGSSGVDLVAGIESRGFILGGALAVALSAGFVPIRKPGKLPRRTERVEYALEYGSDAVEVHADDITAGARVAIVDDVLATGGTASAAARLIANVGGDVVGAAFLIELRPLRGRERLAGLPISCVLGYD
jgi:adenine phosphoribosyltransferase